MKKRLQQMLLTAFFMLFMFSTLSAQITFDSGFENGITDNGWWVPTTSNGAYLSISSDAREGNSSVRIPTVPSDKRNELVPIEPAGRYYVGTEYWVGFSIKILDPIVGYKIISQHHSSPGPGGNGYSGPNSFTLRTTDSQELQVNTSTIASNVNVIPTASSAIWGTDYSPRVPYQLNTWIDVVLHFRYAHDNTGFIEVWIDGNKIVDYHNTPTTYRYGMDGVQRTPVDYQKIGNYHGPDVSDGVLLYDAFRIGEGASIGYDDVAPGGSGGAALFPKEANIPIPDNGETQVAVSPILNWHPGSEAISHNVYFGTSSPPTFIGNQASLSYDPGLLTNSTTYYWRIDEVGNTDTIMGIEWSFTTEVALPEQATSPNPADGSISIDVSTALNWISDDSTTSHNIYFGTNTPPPLVGNQIETSYEPGALSGGTTYYWRIDAINASGTTKGTVWNFTTAIVTGIINQEIDKPTYPNPFSTSTNIQFNLNKATFVNLVIYNTSGKLVADLISEERSAGSHTTVWNPNNSNGVSHGIYIYQLSVADEVKTGKLLYRR